MFLHNHLRCFEFSVYSDSELTENWLQYSCRQTIFSKKAAHKR